MEKLDSCSTGGGFVFVYEDYMYRMNGRSEQASYYKCENPYCPARGVQEKGLPLRLTTQHSHDADSLKVEILRFLTILRRRCRTEKTPIPKIYKEEELLRPTAASAYGGFSKVKRMLYRSREKKKTEPPAK